MGDSPKKQVVRWISKRPAANDFDQQVGLQQNKIAMESLHDFQMTVRNRTALAPHLQFSRPAEGRKAREKAIDRRLTALFSRYFCGVEQGG
jgi:hypothetical protein